jgi:hypothetical protein
VILSVRENPGVAVKELLSDLAAVNDNEKVVYRYDFHSEAS